MENQETSTTPIFDSLVFKLNHKQEMCTQHINDSYGIEITHRPDGSDSPYAVMQVNYTNGKIEVMKNSVSKEYIEKLLSVSVFVNDFKQKENSSKISHTE